MKIYLVLDCSNYEGSSAMLGFSSREEAEKLTETLRAYQTTRPRYDPAESIEDEDKTWNEFEASLATWREGYPAQGYGGEDADFYGIQELEVRGELGKGGGREEA